jgi:hypothetical protein
MFSGSMNLDALKQEAAALDESSRKELLSFLLAMREEQWARHAREAARKLDDPNLDRWLTIEEFKSRLDRIPEPPAS